MPRSVRGGVLFCVQSPDSLFLLFVLHSLVWCGLSHANIKLCEQALEKNDDRISLQQSPNQFKPVQTN